MKKFNEIREENEKLAAKNDSKDANGNTTETKEWKIERSWVISPEPPLGSPPIYLPIPFNLKQLSLEDLLVI